jgi:nitrogen-specific signal transduction histidine kinase
MGLQLSLCDPPPSTASARELKAHPAFLNHGGEMGVLIRGFDWSATPLGAPHAWPQALQTSVALLLNAKQPVYIAWGPELTSLYNDGYMPILGAKHGNALGAPFARLWSEIWDTFKPIVDATMAGDAQHFIDMPIPLAGRAGVPVGYFTFSYTPLRDETGATAGIYCAATETTDKVLSEQRSEAERHLLTKMFEHAPSFMALLRGPEHRIELANPGFAKLFGNRDLLGKTFAEALPEAVAQGYLASLDIAFASGVPYSAQSARLAGSSTASERYVDFVYQPIIDSDGTVSGVFIEGSDVTARARSEAALRESQAHLLSVNASLEERVAQRSSELMQREEELRHAQKMEAVGQLTGGLAHDFNNILAGIAGSLHVIQKRRQEGRLDEVDRYVKAANEAVARAASITHRMLAFSRRQTLAPKPIDVSDLLRGMSDLINQSVGPGINLTVVNAANL